VERRFRLTRSNDIKRVRRYGKSYAHPLVVLVAFPNEGEAPRFGVIAGRSVGGAVQRNRCKRMLREALRPRIEIVPPGWDILLLARQPLNEATLAQIQEALASLLHRAHLEKMDDADA
jgi:ribonuclease P protein component